MTLEWFDWTHALQDKGEFQKQVRDIDDRLCSASEIPYDYETYYQPDITLLYGVAKKLAQENLRLKTMVSKEAEHALQAVSEIQQVLFKHDFCCLSMPVGNGF
jgi:hypothetical protein